MLRLIGFAYLPFVSALSLAQVFTYEADDYPVPSGWNLEQQGCEPETWVWGGKYHQILDHRACPPPSGGVDAYRRSLAEFLGETRFFLEIRLEADGPRTEIPFGGPAAFALGSNAEVRYTFNVAQDQAKLNRDNRLPIIFVDLEPGIAHTHRLEHYDDDLYIWFIDGIIFDSGIPEGPYPMHTPSIVWVGAAHYSDNVVHWDYIRYGRIADDGSGDFDSDGDVDLRDAFYFVECLDNSGPLAPSGPGCRWADIDGDADTDLRDFSKLQNSYTGSK